VSTKSIERTRELLDQLKERVENVKSSDEFKRILLTMSRFHSYSWRNCLLIFMQCPHSTRVAGFRTWNKMGRHVKKGESAIWIFAPMTFKRKDEDDGDDEEIATMFRPVPVFDISQTEGDPLPSMAINPIANTHEELLDKLKALSGKLKIEITFEELPGMDGVSKIGSVAIDSNKNPTEQSIILLHELAHELIHDTLQKRAQLSKEQREMEAEATAWVVAQHIGLPETNSDSYLALYHKSYDLQESLAVIHNASQQIINSLTAKGENHDEKIQN